MYRQRSSGLGSCCSTGPVAGYAQAEEGGSLLPLTAAVPLEPAAELPWGKLFAVSVAAGLTIHFLTKPRR